jgi:hypothetical protein
MLSKAPLRRSRTRSSGQAIMAAFCLNILNHDNQTVIRGSQ